MEILKKGLTLSTSKPEKMVFVGAGISLTIRADTCRKFLRYQQQLGKNEAGGMLFGSINGSTVKVEDISTPSFLDKRSPTGYRWHRDSANKTIIKFSRKGLHYLGDWHSHPQNNPVPSQNDIESIRSTYNESVHELNYFILFILSNSDIQSSYVALSNGKKEYQLTLRTDRK